MKHSGVWQAIHDLWRSAPDWNDEAESRVSAALDGIVTAEREACAKIADAEAVRCEPDLKDEPSLFAARDAAAEVAHKIRNRN